MSPKAQSATVHRGTARAEPELASCLLVQAQARSEAEAAAAGVSVYGIRHSCVLGACSPEELAALTTQVLIPWDLSYSLTLCLTVEVAVSYSHSLREHCTYITIAPSHST